MSNFAATWEKLMLMDMFGENVYSYQVPIIVHAYVQS